MWHNTRSRRGYVPRGLVSRRVEAVISHRLACAGHIVDARWRGGGGLVWAVMRLLWTLWLLNSGVTLLLLIISHLVLLREMRLMLEPLLRVLLAGRSLRSEDECPSLIKPRAAHAVRTHHPVVLIDPDGTELFFLSPPRGVGAEQVVHVLCKLEVRPLHRFKVADTELDNRVRLQNALVAVALCFEFGQCERRLACVANLSAVPSRVWMILKMSRGKAANAHLVNANPPSLYIEALFNHLHVDFEHPYCFLLVELRVVEADVDS